MDKNPGHKITNSWSSWMKVGMSESEHPSLCLPTQCPARPQGKTQGSPEQIIALGALLLQSPNSVDFKGVF